MTRTILNLKLFSEIKIKKEVLSLLKPLTVFKTMSGFPFLNKSWITDRFHNLQNKSLKVKIYRAKSEPFFSGPLPPLFFKKFFNLQEISLESKICIFGWESLLMSYRLNFKWSSISSIFDSQQYPSKFCFIQKEWDIHDLQMKMKI